MYKPFADFNKKMIRAIEHKDSSASQLLDWLETAEEEIVRLQGDVVKKQMKLNSIHYHCKCGAAKDAFK